MFSNSRPISSNLTVGVGNKKNYWCPVKTISLFVLFF